MEPIKEDMSEEMSEELEKEMTPEEHEKHEEMEHEKEESRVEEPISTNIVTLPDTSTLKFMMKEFITFDEDKKNICIAICKSNNYLVTEILGMEYEDIDYDKVNAISNLFDGYLNTKVLYPGDDFFKILTGIDNFLPLVKEMMEYLATEGVELHIEEVEFKEDVTVDVRESDKNLFKILNLDNDGLPLLFIIARYRNNIPLSSIYKMLENLVYNEKTNVIYKKIKEHNLFSFKHALEYDEPNIDLTNIKIDDQAIRVMKQMNKMLKGVV